MGLDQVGIPAGFRYPDLSNHRPVSDWDKFAAHNYVLASKATEGGTWNDYTWPDVVRQCENRKITLIGFHFLRVGNVQRQVDNFVRALGRMRLPIAMVDVEPGLDDTCPIIEHVAEFVSGVVAKTGIHASTMLLYLPRWVWGRMIVPHLTLEGARVLRSMILVNADYRTTRNVDPYGLWKRVDVLQYTSTAAVPGVDAPADMNVACGVDLHRFREMVGDNRGRSGVEMFAAYRTVARGSRDVRVVGSSALPSKLYPVQTAQNALNCALRRRNLGDTLQLDGRFGPKSVESAIEYQWNVGLTADGVIGPKTWASLGATLRYLGL